VSAGTLDQEDWIGRAKGRSGSAFSISTSRTLWEGRSQKEGKNSGTCHNAEARGTAKAAEYIENYTGKLIHQGESIESLAERWKAFSAVKAGSWGKKVREDMKWLFDKHVLPVLGQYFPRKITLTPLQLLVNKMAEDG
jgi:hypothetical protein